ncbi:hypothetical protein [Aquimarina longa]|uniref:hypothetical protein n=1 Tax=Aquimarina longa TaxID=1080221 RepID=UPI0007806480|nr:hypothetical protein [Aquimarina longa]
MKNLIYLLILTLGIISCSSDNETEMNNPDLIGKWNWTNTDGGIAYHIHETPETTGKIINLNLLENFEYSITENGTEILRGNYEIIMKESIYSGEMESYLTYSTENQTVYQNQNIVLSGIIRILENENLSIADNYADGIESKYIRIE